jgi:hypothetical protein
MHPNGMPQPSAPHRLEASRCDAESLGDTIPTIEIVVSKLIRHVVTWVGNSTKIRCLSS